MKLSSIFLAAIMILALAGQAAEARDHHGWRKGHNHWNRGVHRGWRNNDRHRWQAWNNINQNNQWRNRGNGVNLRPWDTMENRSQHALRLMQQQNRYGNPYWNRYWY